MAEFDALVNSAPSVDTVESATVEQNNIFEEPQENNEEQILARFKLKAKIIHYKEDFPKQLVAYDYKLSNLDGMTVQQLEELLIEIRFAVSCRNSSNLTKMFYFSTVEVAEKIGTHIGFRIQGITKALNENAEIHNCLNELKLKYEDEMSTPPEMRLALITATTLLTFHRMNSNTETVQSVLKKIVPQEVLKEFDDL